MLLKRTISQLDIGPIPPERAQELGQLGFIQWLGSLPGATDYLTAARRAHAVAAPFRQGSPAVAVFCDLLEASMEMPPRPLPLSMPPQNRRGGARARRGAM